MAAGRAGVLQPPYALEGGADNNHRWARGQRGAGPHPWGGARRGGRGLGELLFSMALAGAGAGLLQRALAGVALGRLLHELRTLVFNMAVPMYPMDCGKVVQELLWARIGYQRSMQIAVNVGLVAAVVLGVFGLFASEMRMIALAIFGGMTCYNERQRISMMGEAPVSLYDTDKGYRAFDDPPARAGWWKRRASRAAARPRAASRANQAAVDRILDKIRDQGIQSLSAR